MSIEEKVVAFIAGFNFNNPEVRCLMSYAVSNREGDHLGFILLSGGPDSGDCLVRSLPAEKEHSDVPESMPLIRLQAHGELQWERVADVFRIYDPEGEVALVERGGRMTGYGFEYVVEATT